MTKNELIAEIQRIRDQLTSKFRFDPEMVRAEMNALYDLQIALADTKKAIK